MSIHGLITLREKLPRSVRLRYINWGAKEHQHCRRALLWRHHGRRRLPPPAAVAKLPRATSARAAAGNQLPVPPSPFPPAPRAPTSPQVAGPGPSPARRPPPLFCGEREGRRKGNFAQKPLPFSLFLKEPSHSLTFLQIKPSLLSYSKINHFTI